MKREDISNFHGKEYDKAVKRLKRKTTVKKILSDIVGVVLFFGIIFGGYKLWSDYKSGNAYNDDSYKIETKRDSSYNGIYSLTKLDENGNNTWDGLMLYVENDKVVSCANYDFYTFDDLSEMNGGKKVDESYFEMGDQDISEFGDKVNSIKIPKSKNFSYIKNGFSVSGGITYLGNGGIPVVKGAFLCTDKIDFDKVTDTSTDYDYMKSCDIVSGYDEDSQEVWLSKLLSNEKSIYHDGYKLIHYSGYDDLNKNCKLDNGSCIEGLNKDLGTNLSEW